VAVSGGGFNAIIYLFLLFNGIKSPETPPYIGYYN